ncbi:MAG: DUF3127 domain-containing protein [Nannocystaceae bacterium]
MGLKASGTLHVINETQQISARFQKREFVVQLADNPRYPQFVQFQLTGDRCDALEGFKVGDEVELDFSLRGREWRSPKGEIKYFNSLDVWTIEPAGAGGGPGMGPGMGMGPGPGAPSGRGGPPDRGRPGGGGGPRRPPVDDDIPLPPEPDELPGDDIPF